MVGVSIASRISEEETAGIFPLTDGQEGIWFAQEIDPANPVFNTGHYVEITGALNIRAFAEAVQRTLAEVGCLNVQIINKDQQVANRNKIPLIVEDISHHANPKARAMSAMKADINQPLNMARDGLVLEVEAALLSFAIVRQAVVVMREDQLGDKRIIAYVTVEDGVARSESAVSSIIAHVSSQVPNYMVPSAVILLDAFPVNANGKLDRKALPAPVFSGAQGRMPETESEKLIARLFAQVLKLQGSLAVNDDFFDLGGHSLLAVEFVRRLRDCIDYDPGIGSLFEHSTIARYARYLDEGSKADVPRLQALVKLNAIENSSPQVFMLHPAGGLAWCYNGLARALGATRPVWGIQALALDLDAQTPQSLDAMAEEYANRIISLGQSRMIHLVGWSIGGILAQAVAVHLEAIGHKVGLVAMLDAYPCDYWRSEPDPGPGAELRALLAIGGHDPDQLPHLPLTREAVTAFLTQSGSPLGKLPAAALDGLVRVVSLNNSLVRTHYHRHFSGPVLHFRDTTHHNDRKLDPHGWEPYVGSLRIVDIPIKHAFMTGPEAVALIAPILKTAFHEMEIEAENNATSKG